MSQDFYLSLFAINEETYKGNKEIDFRFLAYRAGYFSSDFRGAVNNHILEGILQGLEKMLSKYPDFFRDSKIKRLTFPHYRGTSEQRNKIQKICEKQGVQCVFNNRDALHQDPGDTFTLALTSTGDSNAVFTNEGGRNLGFTSLDAELGSNEINFGMGMDPKHVSTREFGLNSSFGPFYNSGCYGFLSGAKICR